MSAGLNFHLHALGKKSLFQSRSCWQNSILNNCRTQVPVSLMAVSSQLLKAFCILCQVAPSIFKSVKWEWKSLICVRLFVTLWTVAHQAPPSPWDFPGKNTAVGCHFPSLGVSFQPRDWTQVPCLAGLWWCGHLFAWLNCWLSFLLSAGENSLLLKGSCV